ncbi:MAG: outer membrane protein assembly factor BamB [Methylococcales bacterium]|nr:outer membrane protein assembly factor BamB [Methylococcales bacterium]MBT7445934.1 outer membrane protein assembly factor BamB [Methylococcales bacterium]
MIRQTLLFFTVLSVASCSSLTGYFAGEDNAEPPEPLPEYDNTLQVNVLWDASVGDGFAKQIVQLVPAVGGDRVFAADRAGTVMAFNKTTGEELWENETELAIAAGPGYGSGLVIVGTSDAEVLALNESDGSVAWKVNVTSEILAVPRIADDVVVVRTIDGRLYGLELSTGLQKWFFDWPVPVLTLRGTSAPALTSDMAVVGLSSGKVNALDLSDGELQWESSVSIPSGRTDLERMIDIDADPLISDGNAYIATYQGELAALEVETGVVLWKRKISAYAGLVADWSQLYVVDDRSSVWAVDPDNGASFWKQSDLAMRKLTAPVVQGDYVVTADYEGYLHWLSRSDGSFVAKLEVDDAGISTSASVVDDVLYVLSNDGLLMAVSIGENIPQPAEVEKPAEEESGSWWKPW